jgi:RHS repeat-associated protein
MRLTGGRSGPRLAGHMVCGATALVVAVGLVGCPALASAGISPVASASFLTAEGSGASSSSFASPLVVPGVQALDGGQQALAATEARLSSPEAVFARERSRTAFEHLDSVRAAVLAREAFPAAIDEPAGGPPKLPAGQRIVRYLGTHAAQLSLQGGKHAVSESLAPIATQTAPGRYIPISLALTDNGGSFVPKSSHVDVQIPKVISNGVDLPEIGVSLTPDDAGGAPLQRDRGVVDGAGVIYPNTQTDADTLVKPTTEGFELDSLLRSIDSPGELHFRVGMPHGARLVKGKGSGAVSIEAGGQTLAEIMPPSAEDAVGTPVPVSMSVAGDMLTLVVGLDSGSYQFPVLVDPTVTDTHLAEWNSNWRYVGEGSKFHGEAEPEISRWLLRNEAQPGLHEWGELAYPVQPGEARIYQFTSTTSAPEDWNGGITNRLAILKSSSGWAPEAEQETSSAYGATEKTLTSGGTPENEAVFRIEPRKEGSEATYSTVTAASVSLTQTNGPSVAFTSTGSWNGPNDSHVEIEGSDPGVGVSEIQDSSPNDSKLAGRWLGDCTAGLIQCERTDKVAASELPYVLPNGEDTVEAKALDSMGLASAPASAKVKIDREAPYNIKLLNLPANHEIGSQLYHLKAEATDGSGSVPSSGVASIALAVDGKEVGKASGTCSPGPCTATSGEWTISGAEYGVGPNTITLTATDNAGNVEKAEIPLFVSRPTTPVAMGPGSLNPQSGELSLGATDVSVGGPAGNLTLSRSYGSMHVTPTTESEQSALGTGWSMSLAGERNITRLPNGSVLLTTGTGLQAVFASKGGGEYTPPPGDEGLTIRELENKEKAEEFTLTDGAGGLTKFTLAPGGTGSTWVPTTREGADKTNVTTFAYQTVNGVTEPTEELAPVAAGIKSCSPLEKGCRALKFVYASKTTAKGEGAAEWGEYEGRLKEVTFTAWEPTAGKMQTTAVAAYEYDKQGRLRAEWNPQISPSLKTTYGYDATGHITAVTPPGQQPWLFTYGAIAGDTRTGRLLATSRPSASTPIGSGVAPLNTTAPALSASPQAGTSLKVSTGTWSNAPLAYAYQWEECTNEVCTPILGATNQSYTPPSHAGAYTLRAQVTATNGDGSATVLSNTSSTVLEAGYFEKAALFSSAKSGSFSKPSGIAVEFARKSAEDVWVADTGNNRILKFSPSGEFLAAYKEANGKAFKGPEGIAIDGLGYVYIADSGNKRIVVLNSAGAYETEIATAATPKGISAGEFYEQAFGNWFERLNVIEPSANDDQTFSVGIGDGVKLEKSRTVGKEGTGIGDFKDPTSVANRVGLEGESKNEAGNHVYFADNGNKRIETWFYDWGVLEYSSQFAEHGTTGEFASAGALAFESPYLRGAVGEPLSGDVFADLSTGEVQQYSPGGTFLGEYAMGKGTAAIAFNTGAGTNAGDAYVADTTESTIAKWVPAPLPTVVPAPPTPGTTAVTTIEYHVPVSGTGAPYALGKTEAEAWAQKDDPSEATAIFPPDEPEGWPAQNYKRATVYYLDSTGHTVNAASPGGAISTTEYNSTDDVVRTLTPDNRAVALKEGSQSAEKAKLLDSESTYNSEGDELLETLGPLHTVKLAGSGAQVEARAHTVYSYDEGAPVEAGPPYRLVTKLATGAQTTSKEEFDVRTTTMSYSGQENLGWKLREPTSVTTDPNGLKLTHTTVYEPSTGAVAEARSPKGSTAAVSSPWEYASQFGKNDFIHPGGVAVDAHGNFWVTNQYGDTPAVEKFSSSGTRVGTYGEWGEGNGKFEGPNGIAINQTTGNVYVTDGHPDDIEELNEKGEYVKTIGSTGTGSGQIDEPAAIALDSAGDIWVSDYQGQRVAEFKENGEFMKALGWGVSNGENKLEVCTTSCQAGLQGGGNGQFSDPFGLAFSGGHLYVADMNNARVEEFNTAGEYIAQFGARGHESGQLSFPHGLGADASGNLYVADSNNNRVEEFTAAGAFVGTFGTGGAGSGEFSESNNLAFDAAGEVYVVDSNNNRVQKWLKAPSGSGAYDSKVVYYSAGTEASVVACRNHPEWAELPCKSGPVEQPGTSGLPELPENTTTYNFWDEPEKTTETAGSSTRTQTTTFDAAGRPKTTAISASAGVGTALPTLTDEYSSETGALVKQCTNEGKPCSEGKPKTITSAFNSLGELTSYNDANENTTSYEYDIDGRPEKSSSSMGTEGFTYDPTTGLLTGLVNEYATTKLAFTATYDVEGNLVTEGLPNGMRAEYAYNAVGEPTSLGYVKTTDCSEKCTWLSDAVVPSIHGQWLEQTSTLSHQAYTYDAAGRLTQVQSTPAGKGCTTRIYAYDEDTNRTSLTTREPNAKGECATEGGTSESHTYDSGDRLTDTGTAYNAFGDITSLPAADAGGSELTSAYYTDNQLASETQSGQTIGYNLDPAGRTAEIVQTGKKVEDVVDHYAGPGGAPAWTVNTSGSWTRNIEGIGSGLVAIQAEGAAPVLQLANLHGDIIATAALSETETKLLSTTDTSEFGVPTTSTPAKYSWLGAEQQPTELASGEIDMGARSYIPQLGRFLQTDPQPGGSANAYTYTFGDPVNTSDPSGEYTIPTPVSLIEASNNRSQITAEEIAAHRAAEEAAARATAEALVHQAEADAGKAGPQYGADLPLGGSIYWACDYAEETGQEDAECGGVGGGPLDLDAKTASIYGPHSSGGTGHSCGSKEISCEIENNADHHAEGEINEKARQDIEKSINEQFAPHDGDNGNAHEGNQSDGDTDGQNPRVKER